MPRWGDDELEDEEDDYESEDESEPEPTVGCPYCRAEIHEDAQWCPNCENYLSEEDAPLARRPWWLVAGILICLAIVLSWFFAI